jgi:hypothetical protein
MRIIDDWSRLTVVYHIVIQTRVTSQVRLNDQREKRLNKLLELRLMGWSDGQIANCLNELGNVSPNGKRYTGKLIWVTLKKYIKRIDRKEDTSCQIKSELVYVL